MISIFTKDCGIYIRDDDKIYLLTADDIYSVVFENAGNAQGIKITKADLLSTGLEFYKNTVNPALIIEGNVIDGFISLQCRLIGEIRDFEGKVPDIGNEALDYAVSVSKWHPLPEGSSEAVRNFLKQFGIDRFGTLSLFQYLKLLRTKDAPVLIEDRTNNILQAANLSTVLYGELPTGLIGKPYHYQETGYKWLSFMVSNGLGAIIADEMGLGKTLQVICIILEFISKGKKPCLVISPATLLSNWKREIGKFAPTLNIMTHRGSKRTGRTKELLQYDVILVSYETAVIDISLFQSFEWELVVVDEAQGIKNPFSKRSVRLRDIPRRSAIAITGTPVENHLMDIWAITDFVVPSLLGTQSDFELLYPDSSEGAVELEPIITPLILRRLVSEVAKDLPPRIDIPQPLELDSESAAIYEELRLSASGKKGNGLASLMHMRMFCTHPWLVEQLMDGRSAIECSPKLQRLKEIIEEIIESKGKILVFTSFQKSADIISAELQNSFGMHADIIDGRVPVEARQEIIDQFGQYKDSAALILNPKAAGTGLNITAANHVIHYNLEWNPAVEDQASARAHRRGQDKIVTVHRFFYVNTVEDIINERIEAKRQLSTTAIVGGTGTETDVGDILRALQISPVREDI